jgi:hypothetical protein
MAGSQLLRPELAPIDGRKLGDMLEFVYKYARLVVFHEYKVDAAGKGYVELSNWLRFFERSLPFTLNQFTKSDFVRLEADLRSTIEAIEQKPNDASLRLLLDFCYFDLITPLNRLQQTAQKFNFEQLGTLLNRIARTSLLPPLRRFIELSNVAAKYFCTTKYDFMAFTQAPWDIPIEGLFVIDETVVDVPGGQAGAIAWLGAEVAEAAQRFTLEQRNIAQEIPGLLNASIDVLDKRNDPHLGLLYAFLRLFEHFQGELNGLTQKHLEYFYTEVLRLKRRDMVPDQVHLVFEPAKHLKSHLIKQGTRFKDAKDSKKVDILFDLDEEIVIDKAKVAALKTLFLNHSQGCLEGIDSNSVPRPFVEGVYIAPVANSADGKGGAFKEEQSKNWSTLGAKLSKYTVPGEVIPQQHPFGRIGFILASPVLLLREGRRDVKITIECDAGDREDGSGQTGMADVHAKCFKHFINGSSLRGGAEFFDDCFDSLLSKFSREDSNESGSLRSNLIDLRFSGQDGWFKAESDVIFSIEPPDQSKSVDQTVKLKICARLEPGESAVTFYDETAFDERLAIKRPFPMVKIELNPDIRLECNNNFKTNKCCLTKDNSADTLSIALYHFLRHLRIIDIDIQVEVCGVKNLVVQNEESLQDVNSPILPFGARPKVGAEFYIGNKELFCKNWQKFWLHINWKDKPKDLKEHYETFKYGEFEDGSLEISDESFTFAAAVLEDQRWKVRKAESDNEPIFVDSYKENPCDRKIAENDSSYLKEFERGDFVGLEYEPKSLKPGEMEPLSVNSDKGFYRMTLDGVSFQHHRYSFVLAWKLEELSRGLRPFELATISQNLNSAIEASDLIAARINSIEEEIEKLLNIIDAIDKVANDSNVSSELMALRADAVDLLQQMKDLAHPPAPPPPDGEIPPIEDFEGALKLLETNLFQIVEKLTNLNHDLSEMVEHINSDLNNDDDPETDPDESGINQLKERLDSALQNLKKTISMTVVDVKLPLEPYTPLIKALEVDYFASADTSDIELIHLHPFPKTSKTEMLIDIETLQDYDLSLRSVSSLSDLPDQEESLVIVSLVNPNRLCVRIFDDRKKIIVDKTETELDKEKVDDLKKLLKPFPDNSSLSEAKRQEIIDKAISISTQSTLLPTFTDEGTLYIGLEGLRPRSNLHLLFKLAEATADSEIDRVFIKWHYLAENRWKALRTGFELLSDKTEQMTRSGIVKIALPEDISNKGNTLMPPTDEGHHLFWLKVSAPHAVAGVADLVGVHAQAASTTYKPLDGSDRDRVAKTLEPEQIGKTLEPDFGIKKIQQPYKSFGGRVAESMGSVPIRMSELLRHKGRSVDAFDVEHLVLDAFPELFKCKCISHTMGLSARQYQRDLEVAPGFIIVAVVPDLTKLEPGDMLEPMAPVSMLTKVKKFLEARVSPFARIRVKNPRYEQVHVRLKVRLRPGLDESYYLSQLKTDLCHFLAPWHLGDSDKLSFGQNLVYSDVLGFIEALEYIDVVTDMRLFDFNRPLSEQDEMNPGLKEIVPLTARSIFSPGDIEIKPDDKNCGESPATQPNEYTFTAFLESSLPRPVRIPGKVRDGRKK